MASSAPSSFAAASSSRSWNHDVFLSFRGEDTRKTFVDHLYTALQQRGIFTYKDDETLPRGESIGPSLLKAIQESQIAVIVFSKNYADSSWCLEELATIMECKEERGQIVFPIFYDVNPSEVRKQNGELGKAFDKQENHKRVESWRKALVGAANLSGWEPKNVANGHESRCIKEIVDAISIRLVPLMSSTNTDLIGMDTRVQDLKSRLEMGSAGVRMVGIWGVGGGGKTTLAFSVYKEISHGFDGCSFIENVREESSKHGLRQLQEKVMLDVLRGNKVNVGSIEEGKCIIKSRLRHKSVLLILDDVDHLDHLEALCGSNDWFGVGSRIIITTRDVNLLEAHRVNIIHNVSLLTSYEAIKLFSRHAFGAGHPVDGYEELSLNVVSKVGGLPLAHKILGSFLCGKVMSEWISALARLKDIPDSRILEKLKISYDGLQSVEKELFLDIACFFRRHPKEKAMDILDACGFHPVIGVKVLIQKALITITTDGMFDMHDVVQEMGHYIVRGKDLDRPHNHSRVWKHADIEKICTSDALMENNKIEAIRYIHHKISFVPQRLPEILGNIKRLRLIVLYHGESHQLGKKPKFLSNELRWISWYGYPASSFPPTFHAPNLGRLELVDGLQKQLWKGYKHLPCLKVLDLSYSRNLIRTPNFGGLPILERLIIKGCDSLTNIHSSIGHHERLVFVDLRGCLRLEMFPPIVRMNNLETLQLSHCPRLRKFPEIQMEMYNLKNLCLDHSGIEVVPSSIGRYCTTLVSIDLSSCEHLKSIEGNFRLLRCLEKLHLQGCIRLEKLPVDLFDEEVYLKEASLPPKIQSPSSPPWIMMLLKNLLSCIWLQISRQDFVRVEYPHLPCFLIKLDLSRCHLVDNDISNIGELNLRVLDLSGNNFSRLHSSLLQFPMLKILKLSDCKKLVELPKLPSSIAILKADDCDSFEMVEGFPTNLKWLWNVSLLGENKLSASVNERVLQSMLQGNAIESHFISLCLPDHEILKGFAPLLVKGERFTLQLPKNWYDDFSGFILCAAFMAGRRHRITISMRWGMGMDSESQLSKEFDIAATMSDYNPNTCLGYVSFGSLSHTTWWNSTYNTILFSFDHEYDDIYEYDDDVDDVGFGVRLVPRRSEIVEPSETTVEFWDQEYTYGMTTFTIIDKDSKSALDILWRIC